MLCPECGNTQDKVIDSREGQDGPLSFIRRRRECGNGHRFTTYETAEKPRAFEIRKTRFENLIDNAQHILTKLKSEL